MRTLRSRSRCSSPGSRRVRTVRYHVFGYRRSTPCLPRGRAAPRRSRDPYLGRRISRKVDLLSRVTRRSSLSGAAAVDLSVGREVPKTQYPYIYQTWVVGSLGTVEHVTRTVLAELAAKSQFLTPTPAPANIRDMLFSSWGICLSPVVSLQGVPTTSTMETLLRSFA